MTTALEAVATSEKLDADIEKLVSDPSANIEFPPPAIDSDDDAEFEDAEPPSSKKQRTAPPPKTTQALLEECGLAAFKPLQNDNEAKMFRRVRSMFAPMQAFTAFVRIEEGILSRASITGLRKNANLHAILQHWLAKAKESFHCSEAKQTRHALWGLYTESCKKIADSSIGDSEASVSAEPTHFNPCCTLVENSTERSYQLLVVRPTSSSSLRFGVTMHVWRGGLHADTARSSRKLVPDGFLKAEWTVTIHVILLMPHGDNALYGS